jgi:hypothetical protein
VTTEKWVAFSDSQQNLLASRNKVDLEVVFTCHRLEAHFACIKEAQSSLAMFTAARLSFFKKINITS